MVTRQAGRLATVVILMGVAQMIQADGVGLVGHWKLAGDCNDHSGNANHGINHGVGLEATGRDGAARGAALFGGRGGYIEVPHTASLRLGSSDFTIAAWVKTHSVLDDVLGDIVSKFDPDSRRGLNLAITSHAGMTSSQSNYRNLHFGIDNGATVSQWIDCGRPGESVFGASMAVWEGDLYVGTCEPYGDGAGRVYRYLGGSEWEDLGSPDGSNTVMAMAVYRNRLYVGTAAYNTRGSLLPEAENTVPGGRIFRYDGPGQWTDCGSLPDARAAYALCVYRDRLYGIAMYVPGVFRWDGDKRWEYCGTPGDERSMSLAVHNGGLWVSGNGGAGVYRHEGGEQWRFCGKQQDNTQTYSFAIHAGQMYVGTWPDGSVHRYDGGERWANVGRCAEEKEVMAMAVYNGKMYVGTLPLGAVYRYDGPNNWPSMGQVDITPEVPYRRVWSMAVYDGKLFAGTLPSGRIYSLEVGRNATHDREFPPGWQHIAAVRDGGVLRLYLNGQQVAASEGFDPAEYDISTDEPLRIGFGAHDYFNGAMSDVRLYNRALSVEEIDGLR